MRKRYSISFFQMLIEFWSIMLIFFNVISKNVCAIGRNFKLPENMRNFPPLHGKFFSSKNEIVT
jgi:hypothetical protein